MLRIKGEKPEPQKNWQGLADGLRNTAVFGIAYMASKQSTSTQAALTMLGSSLSATHNLQDLYFFFSDLITEIGPLWTPALNEELNSLLEENGFEPL